jgi:hypothetical protein
MSNKGAARAIGCSLTLVDWDVRMLRRVTGAKNHVQLGVALARLA